MPFIQRIAKIYFNYEELNSMMIRRVLSVFQKSQNFGADIIFETLILTIIFLVQNLYYSSP